MNVGETVEVRLRGKVIGYLLCGHVVVEIDKGENPTKVILRNDCVAVSPRDIHDARDIHNERKSRALMQIIHRLMARYERGLVVLDEPSFELFELAKRISWAKNEKEFQTVLTDLANFKK